LDDELVWFEFKSDGEGAGNTISTYAQIIPTMLEKMLDVNLGNIHKCTQIRINTNFYIFHSPNAPFILNFTREF